MEINTEKEKKRKQSLDEKVFNSVILALEAPVNANVESASQTLENNTARSSSQKKKRKKKKHKTAENNSLAQKLPEVGNMGEQGLKELEDMEIKIETDKMSKQPLDENLVASDTVDLVLNAPDNGNTESALPTLGNNTEGSSIQKKKRKKKKHKTEEYNSLAQKLPEVGNMGEQGLNELEDMEIKIETDKMSKQSLDENLVASNTVDLVLNAPDNGNTESALPTLENNTEGSSSQEKKRKKKKHKTAEDNSLAQKQPEVGNMGEQGLKELEDKEIKIETDKTSKQSFDESLVVSDTVDLVLNASDNGNTEMAVQLQTIENNIDGSSTQKKRRKKKKHKVAENYSPVQKLPEVGNMGEQGLKELEGMEVKIETDKTSKQSSDEKLVVSDTVDLVLNAPDDGNTETAVQLQTTENNIDGGPTQKKRRKKKKHKVAENDSPVQNLPEVGNMVEKGLKELKGMEIKTEKEKNRKQSAVESFLVSNSDDLSLKTPVNGNTETCLQTADNNIEEASSQKKRKKKKHKNVENNSPVKKLVEVGNLGEPDRKELDDMEIDIVKEKKRKKYVDENLEVSDTDYLSLKSPVDQSLETALQTAENHTGGSSGRNKKRKKKECKAVENNNPVPNLVEDGNLGEQDVRELEDVEININKDKKRRHILNENMDISNADDLSLKSLVNGNMKTALRIAEKSTGGSSSLKKKRKEKKCKALENNSPAKQLLGGINLCEQDGKELENVMDKEWKIKGYSDENKEELEELMDKEWKIKGYLVENKVNSKVEDLTMKSPIRKLEMVMQITENNAEGGSRKKNKRTTKKKCKVAENNEPVQDILESGIVCNQDQKNIKHLEKLNHEESMGDSLILELVKSVDIDLKKNDKVTEITSINNSRQQRRKGKKKRLCSSASSTQPAYVMQTAQNSTVGEVSVSLDNIVSSRRELGDDRKNREDELNEAQKSVREHGRSEERKLEELPNMLCGCSDRKLEINKLSGVKETEDELNKIQKTVLDPELSGKQSVKEFLTCCDKEEKSSLETENKLDSAAHILLNLRHGNCYSSESFKEGLNTQSQSVENISIGESSANCACKSPTPGKGVKRKKKVYRALLDSPCDAFPKLLEQKNEIKNESVQLDEVTEGCHVLSEGNLEVSIAELKREEIISSGNGSVMNADISVGAISKEDNLLEKLPPLPERSPFSTRKKLLILDLNGLLADIVSDAPKGFKADKKIAKKSLFKRSHCDEFLKFCFERFDVGVWSSRYKKNVDSVVDFLMKDMKHKLLFCWAREVIFEFIWKDYLWLKMCRNMLRNIHMVKVLSHARIRHGVSTVRYLVPRYLK
ncbi:WD repeat-containing protein 87-like isoform X2 [Macadamia integrifolia]|uniref:WD repeat-containing protein 87-like isoform X2 n=1 Tax=Macadamia integrifolia TaxID=60698 RepID=UPI001C50045F|nr:WD repeat-containing protein 87-like isoform X2 [Macadamia integrifolia]